VSLIQKGTSFCVAIFILWFVGDSDFAQLNLHKSRAGVYESVILGSIGQIVLTLKNRIDKRLTIYLLSVLIISGLAIILVELLSGRSLELILFIIFFGIRLTVDRLLLINCGINLQLKLTVLESLLLMLLVVIFNTNWLLVISAIYALFASVRIYVIFRTMNDLNIDMPEVKLGWKILVPLITPLVVGYAISSFNLFRRELFIGRFGETYQSSYDVVELSFTVMFLINGALVTRNMVNNSGIRVNRSLIIVPAVLSIITMGIVCLVDLNLSFIENIELLIGFAFWVIYLNISKRWINPSLGITSLIGVIPPVFLLFFCSNIALYITRESQLIMIAFVVLLFAELFISYATSCIFSSTSS
jgi:hypothetical protein